jgi:hypothetical protein
MILDTRTLTADAERLLATLAPELGNVRVLDMAELPEHLRTADIAYTAPSLSVRLGADGQRPRPTIVVNLAVFQTAGATQNYIHAIAIHEGAHVLTLRELYEHQLSPEDSAAMVAETDWPRSLEPVEPWRFHGPDFIRAALHLASRSSQRGEIPHYPSLGAGAQYAQSSIGRYYDALGGEPFTMAREPFDAILATNPPREFSELWHRDVRRWLDSLPNPTPAQCEAAEKAFCYPRRPWYEYERS